MAGHLLSFLNFFLGQLAGGFGLALLFRCGCGDLLDLLALLLNGLLFLFQFSHFFGKFLELLELVFFLWVIGFLSHLFELLLQHFLGGRQILNRLLLLGSSLVGLRFLIGLIVIENGPGGLLILRGGLEFLRGGRNKIFYILANEIGAVHQLSLIALEILGLDLLRFLELLCIGFHLFLINHGLLDIADGLTNNFLLVTLGSKNAGEIQHGIAGAAFVTGSTRQLGTF